MSGLLDRWRRRQPHPAPDDARIGTGDGDDASARRWNEVISAWLAGGSSVPDELAAWAHAYGGAGQAAPVHDALPEPWFGDRTAPSMVFLALNPGQPFLGEEQWHQRRPLPDLQSRRGLFAEEIRGHGSHAAWARRFPDWSRWVPGGNPFYEARFRFARDWTGQATLSGEDCLLLELYPWHSRRFDASAFRPGKEALELLGGHVLAPLAVFEATPVFAFGAAWSKVLARLGFEEAKRWSIAEGHRLGDVKDRAVSLFARDGVRIVVERHAGGAGPPKRQDVPALRTLLAPHL